MLVDLLAFFSSELQIPKRLKLVGVVEQLLHSNEFYSISSTSPTSGRIVDALYPKESEETEREEREQRAYMLDQSIIGQKSASDIRKTLRHKKKYETEL